MYMYMYTYMFNYMYYVLYYIILLYYYIILYYIILYYIIIVLYYIILLLIIIIINNSFICPYGGTKDSHSFYTFLTFFLARIELSFSLSLSSPLFTNFRFFLPSHVTLRITLSRILSLSLSLLKVVEKTC